MSVALGVETETGRAVAYDTLVTTGSVRHHGLCGDRKVVRVGGTVIAFCGLMVYRDLLEDYCARNDIQDPSDERDVFSLFLDFFHSLKRDYHFVFPHSEMDDHVPFADLHAEFLVVNEHGLFRVKEILSVGRMSPFAVIGSGAAHAEGALAALYEPRGDAARIARRAVEIAMQFDCSVGGEVKVITV